jgi:hypothetical protein
VCGAETCPAHLSWLEIRSFSEERVDLQTSVQRPRTVSDLFSTRLTSGEIVDPGRINLGNLTDRSFLLSLAQALDAAVITGLDIAKRIGWDGERRFWQLGQLHRVYYVPAAERAAGEHEPDEFHRGIAPSVKLLHAAILRLIDIDVGRATEFIRGWKLANSSVHLRLWAALSRDRRITPPVAIGPMLLALDDRRFWNLHDYPEIAELRAKRFSELAALEQAALTARIRKLPPRSLWPRKVDADVLERGRLYWALRELKRIEIAAGFLSQRDKLWLESNIGQFPELSQMSRFDEGFMGTPQAQWVSPNPDGRYDLLEGVERLKALEAALSATRTRWDNDPREGAADWIRQPGNSEKVLADLETTPDGGAAFAQVWENFGWSCSMPREDGVATAPQDLQGAVHRILALLVKLPKETLRQAIEGISNWLEFRKRFVVLLPEGLTEWFVLWPIAVEATNARQPSEDEIDLNTVVRPGDEREPTDLDTLNTPAGKLVGIFLEACPNLKINSRPFDVESELRLMRETIIEFPGRSGLIARHRMIESLDYFLNADPDWTEKNLIAPLIADDKEALALWRAIARRTQFGAVLEIIGDSMAERAIDIRLGRETRRSLAFSLVVECLHAFREQRKPAVASARIQQMIRALDDEVRAFGAEAIQRFVRDASVSNVIVPNHSSPEALFRSAAAPFLQQVWPQERSLATPGVSKALADLPATARGAFAEAVNAIERFLVPFECWSMLDFGLYGKDHDRVKLSIIDDQEKAAALLRLLNAAIGATETSVIPYDLADALDQIRKITPNLTETHIFRRLATAARRS